MGVLLLTIGGTLVYPRLGFGQSTWAHGEAIPALSSCGGAKVASVRVTRGSVLLRRAGKWQKGKKGLIVRAKDEMRTGKKGRTLLQVCDKSSLYVNHNSDVRIVSADQTYVQEGEVVQLVPAGKQHELRTPVADAFGTYLDVHVQPDGRTVFFEVSGIAQVENNSGSVVLHADQTTTIVSGKAPSQPTHVDAKALTSWTSSVDPPRAATPTPTDVPIPTPTSTLVPTSDLIQFSGDPLLITNSVDVTSSQPFPDSVATAECFIPISRIGTQQTTYGDCVGYQVTVTCGGNGFDNSGSGPDHGAALSVDGRILWTGENDRGSACSTVPGVGATLSAEVTGLSHGQGVVSFWNNDSAIPPRSGCVTYADSATGDTTRCFTNTRSGNNGAFYETMADASSGTIYETPGTLSGNLSLGGVFILPGPGGLRSTPTPVPTATSTSTPVPTQTPTLIPTATSTVVPTPTPTNIIIATLPPTPTVTPLPTWTPRPTPTRPTSTPIPTPTPRPTPTPTQYIIPEARGRP